MKKLSAADLTGLDDKQIIFVVEYTKDWNAPRAAVVAGFRSEHGYKLRDEEKFPHVAAAIKAVQAHRMESSDIDAEWLKAELVDNHYIAREKGNISASNTALATLGKHAAIDAFAAEKVVIEGAEAVIERLQRARTRINTTEPVEEEPAEPPTFF